MNNSITLEDLIDNLSRYLRMHPDDANKPVFFDGLHINGDIIKDYNPNILTLI